MKTALRVTGAVQLLLCLLMAACATAPAPQNSLILQCSQQIQALQREVQQHRVTDAQSQPVADFPSYRTNRFWSSFATQNLDEWQQRYWRYQLHRIGLQGLAVEWTNLPQSAKDRLLQQVDLITFDDFKQRCGEILFVDSLARPLPAKSLIVADSYNDWQRLLGLYAITKYAAASSIADYQNEMRGYFDSYQFETVKPPRRYVPENVYSDSSDWAFKLQQARSSNPLSIPELKPVDVQQLAQRFAPEFIIEQHSVADQPGVAGWQQEQRQIDGKQPVVYFYPSYIRYHEQVLLQLNYTLWFSERPKPTRYDWYGGKLDGLVWRVTLNSDAGVLFFDSIHPCGCFHSVHLPKGAELARKLTRAKQPPPLEPVLFFQTELAETVTHVELSIAADTHYLVHVAAANSEVTTEVTKARSGRAAPHDYEIADYDQLRVIPTDTESNSYATRNWFDVDGIIASSARFERFFLWPLGVPNAGAMRQQGHQAIAFVGKRHFDEASVEALLDFQ